MFKLFCGFVKKVFMLYAALSYQARRPSVLQIDPVQQQLQGLRGQADFGPRLARAAGPTKGAFLQPLGQHTDARAVKIKNLDPVAPPVAKDKEGPAPGVFPQPPGLPPTGR